MRIVVLGASGQIGSAIYNSLRDGHEVIGTSRKASADCVKFDPFQENWQVLGSVDVLINCIGQIEATRTSNFHHIHVDLARRILANRQQIGNPAILQISALGASAAHNVEFLRTKGIADELLLQHPDTAVIRPSIVCTHRTMIVKKMLMLLMLSRILLGTVPVPKGFLQTRIQPVMPQDLVELVKQMCLDRNERIVNAVGPEAISFHEIIQIMMEIRHQQLKIIEVPKRLSDVIIENFVSNLFPKIVNAQQYQLLFEDNIADVKMAEKILGRRMRSTRQFFKNEFTHAIN